MDTHYLLLLSATVRISTFVYLYLYIIPFTLTHHLPYTPCYFTIERGSVHLVRVRERVSHKPFTNCVPTQTSLAHVSAALHNLGQPRTAYWTPSTYHTLSYFIVFHITFALRRP